MPEGNSTSFIPKNANRVRKPTTSKRIYIFSYISYVFFFGTLLTVLGVYVYSVQVSRTLENQKEQLSAQRSAFNESDIAQIRDLEKRLIVAEQLLESSSAPSRLFSALEPIVLDSVRLVEFSYELLPSNNFILSFSGATDTFDSAIFQRDLITTVPALASAEISEYSYGTAIEGTDSETGDTQAELVPDERLVVTFKTSASTMQIPYEPQALDVPEFTSESATTDATSTDAVDDTSSVEVLEDVPDDALDAESSNE